LVVTTIFVLDTNPVSGAFGFTGDIAPLLFSVPALVAEGWFYNWGRGW